MLHEEAEQQIRIWLRLAYDAYDDRQLVRAIHYFHRALDYAQEKGQNREVALICRDLGYVYAREESLDKALACFDQGLAITGAELSIRTGLMANKASVLARLGEYRPALELLEECSSLIRAEYRDLSPGDERELRLAADPRLMLHRLYGDDLPEASPVPGEPQIITLRWPEPRHSRRR